jgi:hypothetical protein
MLEKLFGDSTWLIVFHTLLGTLLVYGVWRDLRIWYIHKHRKPAVTAELTRGDEAWARFGAAWGLLSLLTQQILQVSASAQGYLVFLSLFDLTVLAYLCFLNGWFRNNLIHFYAIVRKRKELA